jgi:ketosteroid isomerase-like protein
MKNVIMMCVALILLSVISGAQAGPKHGDEGQILALENAWNQAELAHDPSAMGLILTDDFVITEPDGTLQTRQQHFAFAKDKSYHYDLLVSEDFRIKVYGDTGIVTGTYHEKGRYKGKLFDRRGRFTDTWIKVNGGAWQCAASHDSLPVKN